MKYVLSAILFVVISNHSAQAFPVEAHVRVTPHQVVATIHNFFIRPLICDARAEGITYYGQPLFSFLDNVVIYPGMNAFVYVNAFPGNHFVNGRAFANCDWFY
jgi:hypothetical protein